MEALRCAELFLPEKAVLLRTLTRETQVQNYVSINTSPFSFDTRHSGQQEYSLISGDSFRGFKRQRSSHHHRRKNLREGCIRGHLHVGKPMPSEVHHRRHVLPSGHILARCGAHSGLFSHPGRGHSVGPHATGAQSSPHSRRSHDHGLQDIEEVTNPRAGDSIPEIRSLRKYGIYY